MTESVFKKFHAQAWPYRYDATILVDQLVGGIPTDPKVAAGWIKSKLVDKREANLIGDEVTTIMAERGVTKDEAMQEYIENRDLRGFKKDEETGLLYIEGRQVKSCLKEAVSIAVAAGKLVKKNWGETGKGVIGFAKEHIEVVEKRITTGRAEPDGVIQRFVHTFRGNGIQYEEYLEKAELSFTVQSDFKFTDKDWAMIWLTAEVAGIGASRAQGYGRFTVTRWEPAT